MKAYPWRCHETSCMPDVHRVHGVCVHAVHWCWHGRDVAWVRHPGWVAVEASVRHCVVCCGGLGVGTWPPCDTSPCTVVPAEDVLTACSSTSHTHMMRSRHPHVMHRRTHRRLHRWNIRIRSRPSHPTQVQRRHPRARLLLLHLLLPRCTHRSSRRIA